jgi:hypothetical protein
LIWSATGFFANFIITWCALYSDRREHQSLYGVSRIFRYPRSGLPLLNLGASVVAAGWSAWMLIAAVVLARRVVSFGGAW